MSKKNIIVNNDENIVTDYTKPILKWVGGKTQIIDKIIASFPKTINNYHEIFLGGGSVLIAFLENVKNNKIKLNGKVYAYDLNDKLINMYLNIQKNSNEVIKELKTLKDDYESITDIEINRKPTNITEAKTSHESYYYYIRSKYNKMNQNELKTPLASSMFIFINKTCFRGLYREGKNGINVPFGHYKSPSIYDEKHIKKISTLIKDVTFTNLSFEQSLTKPITGDFVYMDPPYAPEKETSFVGYTTDGFGIDKHKLLFNTSISLYNNKISFVMSNSDVTLVKNAFTDNNKFVIDTFSCKRCINSKNPKAKTNEILIKTVNLN